MENLITSKPVSFHTLAKKYENFITPAVSILIDNTDISDSLTIGITDVNITLVLEGASTAVFTLINLYDLENSTFLSKVKSTIRLGSKISIKLGYGSKLTEVFCGYIKELFMEFGDMPAIRVTALDVRDLMRMNKTMVSMPAKKKAWEIADQMMKPYQKISNFEDLDKNTENEIPVKKEDVNIKDVTDYDYITRILGPRAYREFLVIGDTAYFKEPFSPANEITTLSFGNGLTSFTSKISYLRQEIKVYYHDEKTNKDIVTKAEVDSDKDAKAPLSQKQVFEKHVTGIDTTLEAKSMVEFEKYQLMKESQKGNGTCIGLPELIPGRYIKISNLDDSVNQCYYLEQVTHSFGTDGFTTEFDVGGWKK